VEAELLAPGSLYYIIYTNDKPAGFSKIILDSSRPEIPEQHITKLERIYLTKEHYGNGLGQELFMFVKNVSISKGQKGMWLYVWFENDRAIRFYERQGFKIIGKYDFQISARHSNPNHRMYLEFA
jgi:ribosomal protein S18 acetylase RimI-like enzyme